VLHQIHQIGGADGAMSVWLKKSDLNLNFMDLELVELFQTCPNLARSHAFDL
jgi:hypothetical protein